MSIKKIQIHKSSPSIIVLQEDAYKVFIFNIFYVELKIYIDKKIS